MTQPYGQQPSPPPQQGPQYGPPPQSFEQQPPEQQPYGRQPYQPGSATAATTRGRFNVVAGVLALVAAVLGILSITVLAWYRENFNSASGGASTSENSKFGKLHDLLSTFQHQIGSNPSVTKYVHFGIAPTYFTWLGYVLLAAAVVLAFISAAPLGGAVVLVKVIAAIVALAGIGATLWAIDLFRIDSQLLSQLDSSGKVPSYTEYLKHTSFGAWAMLAAFLLCFIAAVLPPKRTVVLHQQG